MYSKPVVRIVANGDRFVEPGMKQDTDSHFLFHVVLEVLAITIRQENTKKGVTMTLFSYGLILYLKHPVECTRKHIDPVSSTVIFQDTESVFLK